MTAQHLAGVGGNPGQVPGLEGNPDLPGGDSLRPRPDSGNAQSLMPSLDDLTSDHDRAGHTPTRSTAPALKEDGIQATPGRGIQTQHFQCDMGHRYAQKVTRRIKRSFYIFQLPILNLFKNFFN